MNVLLALGLIALAMMVLGWLLHRPAKEIADVEDAPAVLDRGPRTGLGDRADRYPERTEANTGAVPLRQVPHDKSEHFVRRTRIRDGWPAREPWTLDPHEAEAFRKTQRGLIQQIAERKRERMTH